MNQNSQNFLSNQNNENMPNTFLPQHGHYRHLRVYQVTEMIYDITYYFTQHYLKKGDRTIDQMVQAARSGKQNIAEGNQAAATSSETEIKLTNVAKASLEELLVDYEDYLRVRNLQQKERMHQARTGFRENRDARLAELEQVVPVLKRQLVEAQTEAAKWKAAYEELKQRALKAYQEQQQEIERLKKENEED